MKRPTHLPDAQRHRGGVSSGRAFRTQWGSKSAVWLSPDLVRADAADALAS
jgi:hypothetical protein